jgi:hypothetical protein
LPAVTKAHEGPPCSPAAGGNLYCSIPSVATRGQHPWRHDKATHLREYVQYDPAQLTAEIEKLHSDFVETGSVKMLVTSKRLIKMERETRIELATNSLEGCRPTDSIELISLLSGIRQSGNHTTPSSYQTPFPKQGNNRVSGFALLALF